MIGSVVSVNGIMNDTVMVNGQLWRRNFYQVNKVGTHIPPKSTNAEPRPFYNHVPTT